MRKLYIVLLIMMLGGGSAVRSQQTPPPGDVAAADTVAIDSSLLPAPVSDLTARDKDNDHGHAIILEWTLSPDEARDTLPVMQYEIFRWTPYLADTLNHLRGAISALTDSIRGDLGDADLLKDRRDVFRDDFDQMVDRLPEAYDRYPQDGEFRKAKPGVAAAGVDNYEDSGTKDEMSPDYLPDHSDFYYYVDAVTTDTLIRSSSAIVGPVQSSGQWYNGGLTPVLVAVLLFAAFTIYFVSAAQRGAELYVRPLAGIEAVDDAIGRATEMGRPILYVLGLGTADQVATIASFTILGRVAKRVAEYQTQLMVPTYDPVVMAVAQEVVKSAYMDAGRPDEYKEESVHFVTQMQFPYVAAVNGMMLRERPATNVYMGKFFAESLLLAETGAVAGSIQIAGTDEIAQIPFFIVACDYTLIGEELYAASAYLGREPVLLGSLKAQDWAKALYIALAIVGIFAANIGWTWFVNLFRVTN
jgi:hypothetical protein